MLPNYNTGARSLKAIFPESLVSKVKVYILLTRVTCMSFVTWKASGIEAQDLHY